MTLQHVPGLSCVFPATDQESAIFPRSLASFYWGLVLETKSWVLLHFSLTIFFPNSGSLSLSLFSL